MSTVPVNSQPLLKLTGRRNVTGALVVIEIGITSCEISCWQGLPSSAEMGGLQGFMEGLYRKHSKPAANRGENHLTQDVTDSEPTSRPGQNSKSPTDSFVSMIHIQFL